MVTITVTQEDVPRVVRAQNPAAEQLVKMTLSHVMFCICILSFLSHAAMRAIGISPPIHWAFTATTAVIYIRRVLIPDVCTSSQARVNTAASGF